MTRDVDLTIDTPVNMGAEAEEVVDGARHQLLVAGDGSGRDDNGVPRGNLHLPVIAITGRPLGWSEPFARAWPVAAIVPENGALALIREVRAAAPDVEGRVAGAWGVAAQWCLWARCPRNPRRWWPWRSGRMIPMRRLRPNSSSNSSGRANRGPAMRGR